MRQGNSGRNSGRRAGRYNRDAGYAKFLERSRLDVGSPKLIFNSTAEVNRIISDTPIDNRYSSKANQSALRALPQGRPSQLKFVSLSDEEIIAMTGNLVITNTDVRPEVENGINSLAMGYHGSKNYECATCHQNESCYGHPGRLELGAYVIRYLFIDSVITIIQCVCRNCKNIPVNPAMFNSTTIEGSVVAAIKDACKKSIQVCVNCGQNPYNVSVAVTDSKRYGQIIYSKTDKSDREPGAASRKYLMGIETVRAIISNVNATTLSILGIRIPVNNLVTRIIPVVPPNYRQSVQSDRIIEHPMTVNYRSIIRANDNFISLPEKSRNTKQVEPLMLYNALVGAVKNLVHSDKSSGSSSSSSIKVWIEPLTSEHIPTTAGEHISIELIFTPSKGFNNRIDPNGNLNRILTSKKGLVVNQIFSKRCSGGKAVGSIDNSLEYGQVGIPRAMSLEFTVPMIVTAENYNLVMSLTKPDGFYKNGRILKIRKKDRYEVTKMSSRYTIEIGDEVHRCLREGDIIIVNRFPLIWRHSMPTLTVVFHDGITINMHAGTLNRLNLDFDGDTLIVRVPQSELARKAAAIMHVRYNYIASDTASAVTGLIMDASLGAYFMTSNVKKLTEEQFRDYLFRVHKDNEVVDELVNRTIRRVDEVNATISGINLDYFTSSNLFSTTFPDEFSYDYKDVRIINSIIINGVLLKEQLDTGPYSIVRIMEANHEDDEVADYLTHSNWLTIEWMNDRGSTVGTRDLYIGDDEFNIEVKKIQRENRRKFEVIMHQGAKNNENIFDTERKAWTVLDSAQNKIAKLFMEYCKKNSADGAGNILYHLVNSGKISKEIATQLVASVGTLTYFGQYCPETNGRCTIYDVRRNPGDIRDPRELGYIDSSYGSGLSAEEVIIGTRAAFGGAVATNCSTASFGHTYNLLNAILNGNYVVEGMVVQYIASSLRLLMTSTDHRGIHTERAVKNSRKEFGIGNVNLLADRVNFRYATIDAVPTDSSADI